VSSLRSVAARHSRALEEFRQSDDASLLARLAETECLLEIAKLSAMRVDVNAYAGSVVGIITQFVPSRACALTFEVEEIPPISSSYGLLDGHPNEACAEEICLDGEVVGMLRLVPELTGAHGPELLSTIASQISAGLKTMVEAERLRRRAALSQILHVVHALGDQPSLEGFGELVEALAMLPHALGARLRVEHGSLAAPLAVEAGLSPAGPGAVVEVPGGHFCLAVRWSAAASSSETGCVDEVVEMLELALSKAEERRRLRDDAETDLLTGIGNRRRALRALGEAVLGAQQPGDAVGVVYLDLDHFKEVNDQLGHDVGDQVLVAFARHLVSVVRDRDTVSRYGGEEFLLVCPGLRGDAGVALVQRIIERTPEACAAVLPTGWTQTVSAGFACYPDVAVAIDELIRAADRALYLAKTGGRNRLASAG
jgi:diguanylate cyclase (GGDEF)-like protein